jgi:NAD-specific glutamate dehydrogenase
MHVEVERQSAPEKLAELEAGISRILGDEIIATQATNDMVHRVGSTFLRRMQEETGARIADVVRAYLLTRGGVRF